MADNPKIEITGEKSREPRTTSALAKKASTDNQRQISAEGVFELAPEDDLEVHSAAEIYPIFPEQLDAMPQNLRDSGQMAPVTVYEGQILNGRTRSLARKTLGLPSSASYQPELTLCGGIATPYAAKSDIEKAD